MSQAIAGGLQGGEIRRLVGRVGDHQDDVDDRFGGEARHGRGSHVLDLHGPLAERRADTVLFAGVPVRPGRVRIREPHRSIDPYWWDQELWCWRIAHTGQYRLGSPLAPTPPRSDLFKEGSP